MYCERHTVSITTDASGDGTGYTTQNVTGRILQVQYVKAGSGNYADGVDFTVTEEATGNTIWQESNVNASAIRAPRQPTHSTAGAAALYAAGGAAVNDHIHVVNSRIKIVVAQGGNAGTGTFHIVVG